MNGINTLNPLNAIVFKKGEVTLTLIQNDTEVIIFTDGTDFEKEYSGVITSVNFDGIEVERLDFIKWEYIEEINIIE